MQRVFITGASSGLGAGLARHYAVPGATLGTMIAQRAGVVCAISSMAGHRATPGRAPYAASKKAVTTFMDGLRMDLHGSGVHAMTICPGFVRTPMTDGMKGMMFVVECDQAVRLMAGAIEARRNTFTFPWQMNLLKELMMRAPESLVRRFAPKSRDTGAS